MYEKKKIYVNFIRCFVCNFMVYSQLSLISKVISNMPNTGCLFFFLFSLVDGYNNVIFNVLLINHYTISPKLLSVFLIFVFFSYYRHSCIHLQVQRISNFAVHHRTVCPGLEDCVHRKVNKVTFLKYVLRLQMVKRGKSAGKRYERF